MRSLRLALCVPLFAALAMLGADRPQAARDFNSPTTAVRLELLVLEVRNCNYCSLVKHRIQPAYEQTPHARQMPMRYVDVTSMDETKLGLARPIDTVPTIVLLRDGKEVERISGYVGPENFLKILSILMQRLED